MKLAEFTFPAYMLDIDDAKNLPKKTIADTQCVILVDLNNVLKMSNTTLH